MLMVLDFVVFGGSLAASAYAIGATALPKLDRIGEALTGQPRHFAPLQSLVAAEQRIAVRRWATAPRVSVLQRRAA